MTDVALDLLDEPAACVLVAAMLERHGLVAVAGPDSIEVHLPQGTVATVTYAQIVGLTVRARELVGVDPRVTLGQAVAAHVHLTALALLEAAHDVGHALAGEPGVP